MPLPVKQTEQLQDLFQRDEYKIIKNGNGDDETFHSVWDKVAYGLDTCTYHKTQSFKSKSSDRLSSISQISQDCRSADHSQLQDDGISEYFNSPESQLQRSSPIQSIACMQLYQQPSMEEVLSHEKEGIIDDSLKQQPGGMRCHSHENEEIIQSPPPPPSPPPPAFISCPATEINASNFQHYDDQRQLRVIPFQQEDSFDQRQQKFIQSILRATDSHSV